MFCNMVELWNFTNFTEDLRTFNKVVERVQMFDSDFIEIGVTSKLLETISNRDDNIC